MLNPARRLLIEQLLKAGHGVDHIQAVAGGGKSTITKIRAELGIAPGRPRGAMSAEQTLRLRDLINQGETISAIARLTGVSRLTVKTHKAKMVANKEAYEKRHKELYGC